MGNFAGVLLREKSKENARARGVLTLVCGKTVHIYVGKCIERTLEDYLVRWECWMPLEQGPGRLGDIKGKEIYFSLSTCYGLNCDPQHSYTEGLTLNISKCDLMEIELLQMELVKRKS